MCPFRKFTFRISRVSIGSVKMTRHRPTLKRYASLSWSFFTFLRSGNDIRLLLLVPKLCMNKSALPVRSALCRLMKANPVDRIRNYSFSRTRSLFSISSCQVPCTKHNSLLIFAIVTFASDLSSFNVKSGGFFPMGILIVGPSAAKCFFPTSRT